MAIALRDDLFFCLTDRCAIFLDLAANRYFGLTGTADLALRRIIAGDMLDPDLENALRPLLAKGLLANVDEARPLSPVTNPPPEASLDAIGVPPTIGDTMLALGLYARVVVEMHISGLKVMVRRRRARKAVAVGSNAAWDGPHVTRQVVAAHRSVDQLVGAADRCLARSFALADHLAIKGICPDLVIGVRTGAFAAHCWVQQGQILLNDELDRVRLFAPILIL